MERAKISRRELMSKGIQVVSAGVASAAWVRARTARAGFKIGVCDWTLGKRSDPAALAMAKRLGLDGVQVDLGGPKERDARPQARGSEDLSGNGRKTPSRDRLAGDWLAERFPLQERSASRAVGFRQHRRLQGARSQGCAHGLLRQRRPAQRSPGSGGRGPAAQRRWHRKRKRPV